jgi:hypothetical protein
MTIRARDIYPEFVGSDDPIEGARTLLASVAGRTPPATAARRTNASASRSGARQVAARDGTGRIPNDWQAAVLKYSGSNYGVDHLNNLLRNAPQNGKVSGDRQIVQDAANKYNIPFSLLWATYGAESSWGGAGNGQYFGLTGKYPSGSSGSFRKDAEIAAETWAVLYRETNNGKNPDGSTGGPVGSGDSEGGGGTGSGISAEGAQTIGTAAAFAVTLEGPSAEDMREALTLQGTKSYMNDKPLIEFIDQVCTASMRHYMSLPDGRFYAFFPDYFGSFNHRAPYWEIDDIEIMTFDIYLSDEDLATHVYVVGDTLLYGSAESPLGAGFINRLHSSGVVTLQDAFTMNWLGNAGGSPTADNDKVFIDTNKFLQRYGVRPYYEDAPYIHSPIFEVFVAFQRFMFLWARQFLTRSEFTFMPELYPGGRVSFRDHGVICYVDSVKHEFDYENGFTTTANLSAPSADVNSKAGFSLGMVRPETGGSK